MLAHPTSGTATEFQFLSLFVTVSFLKVRARPDARKDVSQQMVNQNCRRLVEAGPNAAPVSEFGAALLGPQGIKSKNDPS